MLIFTESSPGIFKEEGWVVCRVFKKRLTTMRKIGEHDSPMWYDDQVSFMPDMESPRLQPAQSSLTYQYPYSSCKKELDIQPYHIPSEHFLQLPLLESTKPLQAPPPTTMPFSSIPALGLNVNRAGGGPLFSLEHMHPVLHHQNLSAAAINANNDDVQTTDPVTDWRVLDKFVASQLMSEEDVSKENDYSNAEKPFQATDDQNMIVRNLENDEMATENASTPSSGCQIDMWK